MVEEKMAFLKPRSLRIEYNMATLYSLPIRPCENRTATTNDKNQPVKIYSLLSTSQRNRITQTQSYNLY